MRAIGLVSAAFFLARVAGAQSIVTVAGSGDHGYAGDGGPAIAARLNGPRGVAVDTPSGAFWIADAGNNAIRRVAPDGAIATIAGGPEAGYSGDGGPAAAAKLHTPAAVALDRFGNLFVADADNHVVRRIDGSSGVITTIAGTGTAGFSGENGAASKAQLSHPSALAFDAQGNLYVADEGNRRVRVISVSGALISTYAGNGSPLPTGDGGPATSAGLGTPRGLAFDDDGTLYIADGLNHCVRRVAANGIISIAAGTGEPGDSGDDGPATFARLDDPVALAVTTGSLYVADAARNRVRRVDLKTGIIAAFAGNGTAGYSGEGAPAALAGLDAPGGLVADGNGNLFVADTGSDRVREIARCRPGITAPNLFAPQDAATDVPQAAVLSWDAVPGAFGYQVLLYSQNAPLRTLVSDYNGTSFTASNLLPSTTYRWRVIAHGDPNCLPISLGQSAIQTFTTAAACTAPVPPALSAPADGASVAPAVSLAWDPVPGASTYDLYLGAATPPPLYAKGIAAASGTTVPLAPGTAYSWFVVAHAACDAGKTSTSAIRTFTVQGECAAAGAFTTTSPAAGEANVAVDATLSWSPSANASAYQVFLGLSSDVGDAPPLVLANVIGTSATVPGLLAGREYSWKVVARSACDAAKSTSTAVARFTVASLCATPGAPAFFFSPPGRVSRGQTYGLVWSAAANLDAGGAYVVERSHSSDFSALLDSQTVTTTSASFVSREDGVVWHRVRAVAGCDAARVSAPSAPVSVEVVAAGPSVVFARPPQGVVSPLGAAIEDASTTFTLENLGNQAVTLALRQLVLGGAGSFFSVVDPAGGSVSSFTLAPGAPKTFEVRFSGPSSATPGSYQGALIVVSAGASPLPVTPFAYVNLKVGGGDAATPVFQVAGEPSEYTYFPGLAGDDQNRPPITVELKNPGTTPMEVAGEVGPELWLVPEDGWNATPIAPGATRSIRLFTQRSLAPNGSALPRSTYFGVRTADGKTARILVQDADALPLGGARTPLPDRQARSYVIPSVVNASSAIGNRFVSRLRLSNAASAPVQAELLFTPANADGFDAAAAKRAVVVVPANDVVALNDPLVQVFGLAPPISGQLEVRAAPERIGLLTVTSNVDAAAKTGGTFGFQLPAAIRGEGARRGAAHLIPAITQGAAYRTNLILAETTGIDHAVVQATLYDAGGNRLGGLAIDVPRYGQKQISRVVPALGGGETLSGGRLELEVTDGGGSVVGIVTVIDNTNDDAVTYVSRPMSDAAAPAALARRVLKTPLAAGTLSLVVPSVVNGFPTFRGRDDLPYTFRSLMGFASTTLSSATFALEYHDLQTGQVMRKSVTVGPRQTLEYANVLEQLFGIAPGAKSQGPVLITASTNATTWAKVYSNLPQGTLGDGFPVLAVPSDVLTSGSSPKPIMLDGLEQSTDLSRGTRSNLILNEVGGEPVTVTVRMYEAGNRASPLTEQTITLAPYEKQQLSTVFAGTGLETSERLKDRTNVLCVVTPVSGSGLVAGVVTTIDNKTGDTKNAPLTPAGGVPATGTGTIGF